MRYHLFVSLMLAFVIGGCQTGSVSTETVSRSYPEGACDEAMFQGGLQGGVANIEAGGALYRMHCASCHGADGKGLEKTKRHDFTSPIWHAGRQDLDIADAILRGRAPMMPPIALSESQLRDVIGHVRALKTHAPSAARPSGSGY